MTSIIKKKKEKKTGSLNPLFVVPPGLEPRQTVPKTVVLPLHHGTKSGAKVNVFFI